MVLRVPSIRYADDMAKRHRSYRNLLRGISTDTTKANYAECLKRFIIFHKIDDYDKLIKIDSEQITDMMCDWVDFLTDKNLKPRTVRAMLSGPELFFEMNRKIWHKRLVRKRIQKDDSIYGGNVPFTTEEIQIMLETTKSIRTKALVHFIASTGIRPAALIDPVLCLKHLEKIDDCYTVKIYDESKEGYWAFLTPEASKIMNRYLNWREAHGEDLSPESVIFARLKKNRSNVDHGKQNQHVSDANLSRILNDLLIQSNIKRTKIGKNRYDKAIVYGFRKRFNTILKLNNDVNSNIAEKLMAHKRGLDGTYLQPTREECFAEFKKAVLFLTISDKERQKIALEKKQKELDKEKYTKRQLEERLTEVEELKEKLSGFEDFKEELRNEFREEIQNLKRSNKKR
ncbi:MAG: dynein arm light chain [Nitrosopumilus sp.]|nr:dynein arm light chain [Nitrosopumilus sp.]